MLRSGPLLPVGFGLVSGLFSTRDAEISARSYIESLPSRFFEFTHTLFLLLHLLFIPCHHLKFSPHLFYNSSSLSIIHLSVWLYVPLFY